MNRYLYTATCKHCNETETCVVLASTLDEALIVGRSLGLVSVGPWLEDDIRAGSDDGADSRLGLTCDHCDNPFNPSPRSLNLEEDGEIFDVNSGSFVEPLHFCSDTCAADFFADASE
jgi:hypothetical protein